MCRRIAERQNALTRSRPSFFTLFTCVETGLARIGPSNGWSRSVTVSPGTSRLSQRSQSRSCSITGIRISVSFILNGLPDRKSRLRISNHFVSGCLDRPAFRRGGHLTTKKGETYDTQEKHAN